MAIGIPIAILLVVAYAIAFLTDEPLRGEMTGAVRLTE